MADKSPKLERCSDGPGRCKGDHPHVHCCVPLVIEERPAGAVFVCIQDRLPSWEGELKFLSAVSATLAAIIKQKRMEEAVRNMAEGVSAATGEEFFTSLVRHLARVLAVDYAFLGELIGKDSERVRTTAVWGKGGILENFEYHLDGTPCEQVAGKTMCWYPEGVQSLFPEDAMLEEMGIEGYIGAPLFDSSGRPLGLIVVLHGMPLPDTEFARALMRIFAARATAEIERSRALSNLEENRALLQSVFDAISEPLIMLDPEVRPGIMNLAAKRYYQVEDTKVFRGGPCHRILAGRHSPCEGCEVIRAVRSGLPRSFERAGFKDPDRLERLTMYPLDAGGSGPRGALLRVEDITEEKRLERQLVQNEKLAALGLLVSGIAHEINNPNNFIGFNLPILRDYLQEILPHADRHARRHPGLQVQGMTYQEFRQDLFNLLDNIEHGSLRISQTVSRLKEFARARESREQSWVRPREIVERAVTLCKGELDKTSARVLVEVPWNLPPILADPEALEQVLVNLLINAGHAADKPDPRVTVRAFAQHEGRGGLTLEVRDNGCGMDKNALKRIFTPFFTTKSAGRGTGLGLYVSRNLINAMGGEIHVESEQGKGSSFRIRLPWSGVVPPENEQGPPRGGVT